MSVLTYNISQGVGRPAMKASVMAYYSFDTGGAADDSPGHRYPLSDYGGGFLLQPGKIGQGANGSTLGSADTAFCFSDGAGTDTPFWGNLWMKRANSNSPCYIVTKQSAGAVTAQEWRLTFTTNVVLRFVLIAYNNTANNLQVDYNIAAMNTTDIHMITWAYDATKATTGMRVWLDGVLLSGTPTTTGTFLGMVRQTASPFLLNPAYSGTFKAYQMVDEVAIGKGYILTQADVNYLYNGGAGRSLFH